MRADNNFTSVNVVDILQVTTLLLFYTQQKLKELPLVVDNKL